MADVVTVAQYQEQLQRQLFYEQGYDDGIVEARYQMLKAVNKLLNLDDDDDISGESNE